ncbi:MAG: dihydrolipoamide acetyltransferase family protein [Actinomycetales bacterium]
MIKEFRLPDLGEGLTESEIVDWKVAVGDSVSLNQVIAEVETAKAVVELPSPYDGVVTAIHEQSGTTVEVGSPIISFDIGGTEADGQGVPSRGAAASAGAVSPAPDDAAAKRVPTLVGYGAEVEKGGRPARRARRTDSPHASPQAAQQAAPQPSQSSTQPSPQEAVATAGAAGAPGTSEPLIRPRSTPPVRKLAKDLGIGLATVTGTGPQGLIVREDVLAAAGQGAGRTDGQPANAAPAGAAGAAVGRDRGAEAREVRTPIKGVRKHTAAAMVASAFTAPHVSEFLTVDVTPTMELLARLKANRNFAGYKLGPLTVVAKALCIAAGRQPSVNSRWDEANGEIVTMNYVNLGIAAATPRGLLVPNIKDAQSLSMLELSTALTELTDTARAGKTTPAALAGGTISITNIGVFGIDAGTPILNPGEAAIVAMGAVRRQPWEHNGEVALRQVMTLSLSFDHRLVDGEQGSRFLADIGAVLSDPAMVLTMV